MTTPANPDGPELSTRTLPPGGPAGGAEDADDLTRIVGPHEAPAAREAVDDAIRVAPPTSPTPARPAATDEPTLYPTTPGRPLTRPSGTITGAPSTLPPFVPGAGEAQVRQAGRYRIESCLGRGGMATVYRAHDPDIGRDVAIKFLHAALCQDEDCRTRFLREARAAGGLSHPNIVVVHDVGEIEGRPYMAMELIDGEPLADVLEKHPSMPIRDAVVVALQLARALEYAHAHGIVHRDIKPGNIMLLRDGQSIKVTDFGIAHMEDGKGEQRTQVGTVLGTPQYMSPEQTRGEKLDGRSDLFSAGIVLYQMLAGERPFRGDSVVAVATKIATADPAPVTHKRPEVPASLRRVVERCLAKQPAQRFQSGKELSEALVKVLAEIDAATREHGKPRIVPLRVKWALTMSLIVAVVMGITAAVITQRQYAAMMHQVTEYGASLARFIAAQNAASVLGEEWEVVDVAVGEIMKTRNFERITVIDRGGTVRVASLPALVGQPYQAAPGEALGSVGGAMVARYQVGAEKVLGFEVPVLFQGLQVGRVALGIPEAPLTRVARLSITLMVVLALVTVAAVAIAMYFVADWFARPIRTLSDAMSELAKGHLGTRIAEQRNDEFGALFQDFDGMAGALQQRYGEPPATTAVQTPTAPATPATPAPR